MKAPWTEEQVGLLRQWQAAGFVHPYTCFSRGEGCNRSQREDDGVLIPTTEGWVCPCGKYTQDWCHPIMLEAGSLDRAMKLWK
jgi:hypothetical protein